MSVTGARMMQEALVVRPNVSTNSLRMSNETQTRRRFLQATGMTAVTVGTAGCVALEAPAEGGENPAGITVDTGGESDQLVQLYESVAPALVELSVETEFAEGGGSGFLVDEETIVTNAHVVMDVPSVDIRYQNLEWGEGSVVESDIYSDLAVIEPANPPEDVTLSLSDELPTVGEQVMAIGAPLGFEGSASTGIVSGVNRTLPSPTGFAIPAAIQTDAAINPGSSGGPLVRMDGSVTGVVFAGAGENVGLAISAKLARRVVPTLAAGDTYEHGYIGIEHRDVSPDIATAHDLDPPRGIYVANVLDETPAEGVLRGGVEDATIDGQPLQIGGDIILAVDGEETPTGDHFASYMSLETSPGDRVTFDIHRGGERETVDLELATRPEEIQPPR